MKKVKLLIDTHIWVYFKMGSPILNQSEIDAILTAHSKSELYLSVISTWEVAILHQRKKLILHPSITEWVNNATQEINVIPITTDIALKSVELKNLTHKDPADRFIIATAQSLDAEILTHDKIILDYMKVRRRDTD